MASQDENLKLAEQLPQSPAQEFTLFPRVPVEVRRMIWGYSLGSLGPRVLPTHNLVSSPGGNHDFAKTLIQTGVESRAVVLEAYENCQTQDPRPHHCESKKRLAHRLSTVC
jgi:hypothetical protein